MGTVEIAAQIIGFVGSGMLIGSFQLRSVKTMFTLQLLASVFFSLHFILLGAYVGAVQNILAVIRGFFLIHKDKKWANNPVSFSAFIIAFIVCGLITYSSVFSLFPIFAMVVSTTAMWYFDGYKIRMAQTFAVSPGWLVYNISVFSISGIFTESFNIISVLVSFLRYGKKFGK